MGKGVLENAIKDTQNINTNDNNGEKKPIDPNKKVSSLSELGVVHQTDPIISPFIEGRTTIETPDFSDFDSTNPSRIASYRDNTRILEDLSIRNQSNLNLAGNTAAGLIVNLISAAGQSLINKTDPTGIGEDGHSKSLFGTGILSTRDIAEWNQQKLKQYEIRRKNPGSFDLTDPRWYLEQIQTTGTTFGMLGASLAEVAGTTLLLRGMGTGPALIRLGQTLNKITKLRGIGKAIVALGQAKPHKSSAVIYGVVNRWNEGNMEALQTEEDLYKQFIAERNADGSLKYTAEEAREAAVRAGDNVMLANLALIPLDIIGYRTMVFNPKTMKASNIFERAVSKVADKLGNNFVAKAVPYLVFQGLEGVEEAYQYVSAEEATYFARRSLGLESYKNFGQRMSDYLEEDEFWNNFSGGVIGGVAVGGVMQGFGKIQERSHERHLLRLHADYIQNVAKLHSTAEIAIRKAEKEGNIELATHLRLEANAHSTLKALELDNATNKDTAYKARITFLEQAIEDLKNGNIENVPDSLLDIGKGNITPETLPYTLSLLEQQLSEAKMLGEIYKELKNKYHPAVLHNVVADNFYLRKYKNIVRSLNDMASSIRKKSSAYSLLSESGKSLFDLNSQIAYYNQKGNKKKAEKLSKKVEDINKDKEYTEELRAKDAEILEGINADPEYGKILSYLDIYNSEVSAYTERVNSWKDEEYSDEQVKLAIEREKDLSKLKEEDIDNKTSLSKKIKEKFKSKIRKQKSKQKGKEAIQKTKKENASIGVDDLTGDTPDPSSYSIDPDSSTSTSESTDDVPIENKEEITEVLNTLDEELSDSTDSESDEGTDFSSVEGRRVLAEKRRKERLEALNNQSTSISKELNKELLDRGFTQEEIDKMTPLEANKAAIEVEYQEAISKLSDYEIVTDENDLVDYNQIFETEDGFYGVLNPIESADSARIIYFESIDKAENFIKNSSPMSNFMGSFSPKAIDPSKLDDRKRKSIKDAVGAILNMLPGNASFTELIELIIKIKGKEYADTNFNTFILGWEYNGKNPEPYNDIYDLLFQDPFDILSETTEKISEDGGKEGQALSPEEAAEIAKRQQKAEIKASNAINPVVGQDSKGQPIKEEQKVSVNTRVTNNPNAKISKTIRKTNQNVDFSDDSLEVSYSYTDEGFNTEGIVDSTPLLDVDNYPPGTVLEIAIPDTFTGFKIPTYNPDGTRGELLDAESYLENLDPESEEYLHNVPILIYDPRDPEKKPLGYIHNISWYNNINFSQQETDARDLAIENTLKIRRAALQARNKGNRAKIKIIENRFTTFEPFKISAQEGQEGKYSFKPLSEVSPQSKIVIVGRGGQIFSPDSDVPMFQNENEVLIADQDAEYQEGSILDLRYAGTINGKKHYVAFKITPMPLTQEARETVKWAMYAFSHQYLEDSNLAKKKAVAIQQNVLRETGYNLFDRDDFRIFLSQYIALTPVDFNLSVQEASHSIKARFKERRAKADKANEEATRRNGGIPTKVASVPESFVTLMGGEYILFGSTRPDKKIFFIRPQSKQLFAFNKFADEKGTSSQEMFGEDGRTVLNSFSQNFSKEAARSSYNRPVVKIDRNGNVTRIADSYTQYIANTYNTNISTLNVGTESNPRHVFMDTMVSIELDESSSIDQVEETQAQKQIQKEKTIAPEVKVINNEAIPVPEKPAEIKEESQTESQEKVDPERLKMLNRIEEIKNMLINRGVYNPINETSIQIRLLTSSQVRAMVAEPGSIKGLTPKQQSELINYLQREVLEAMLQRDSTISLDEFDGLIRDSLTFLTEPLKEEYLNLIKELQAFKSPNDTRAVISSLIKEINNINLVESDLNNIIKIVKDSVKRQTGSTTEYKSGDSNFSISSNYNSGADTFGVDHLTLNPENKVSGLIRVFLGGLTKKTADGREIRGVFGTTQTEDASYIIKQLQPRLAGVPARFGDMIEVLKFYENSFPWMSELIKKLENAPNQIKYAFETSMLNSRNHPKFVGVKINRTKDGIKFQANVWDAVKGGVEEAIFKGWVNNFFASALVGYDIQASENESGEIINAPVLNKEYARELLKEFDSWVFENDRAFAAKMRTHHTKMMLQPFSRAKEFSPHSEIAEVLNNSGEITFKLFNRNYVAYKEGGKYYVKPLATGLSVDRVSSWLNALGIDMTEKGVEELLSKGLYIPSRRTRFSPQDLTGEYGPLGLIAKKLRTITEKDSDHYFSEQAGNPVDDPIVKALAILDSKYNTRYIPHGGRDAGKSFYAVTNNKFVTDRARDLATNNRGVRDKLRATPYARNSFWLSMLDLNDPSVNDNFSFDHISFNAIKIIGKKNFGPDANLATLSDLEREVFNIASRSGVRTGLTAKIDLSEEVKGETFIPGTQIRLKWAHTLTPTYSDKDAGLFGRMLMPDIRASNFNEEQLSEEVLFFLYTQIVKPEMERMLHFNQNIKRSNIKGYDKGANIFFNISGLNLLKINGATLPEILSSDETTIQSLEENKEVMTTIFNFLSEFLKQKTNEKIDKWEKLNIIQKKGENWRFNFIDKEYLNSRGAKSSAEIVKVIAYDTIISELVSTANYFMLFSGDPAMYYKKEGSTDSNDIFQVVEDSLINLGKRLARENTPGLTLAESEDQTYIQLFLKDRLSIADRGFVKSAVKFQDGKDITDEEYDFIRDFVGGAIPINEESENRFNALMDKFPNSRAFFEIEGSDAQEYSTWQDHMDILEKLAKHPDYISELTMEDIIIAKDIFKNNRKLESLSKREKDIIKLVLNPLKPVYTGSIFDPSQLVMREMFIKSSSIPLIPQLTAGFEIDKLRQKMEKIQQDSGKFVRASYASANKTGSLTGAVQIWDNEGRANTDNIEKLGSIGVNALELNRRDFRIVQEVPFKSYRKKYDTITQGSQPTKILFADGNINEDYQFRGKTVKGIELFQRFTNTHLNLLETAKNQLYKELSLSEDGNSTDPLKTFRKIQKIIKNEVLNGSGGSYPISILDEIKVIMEGGNPAFELPLWLSNNSYKFEQLLNSIIESRVTDVKMPGVSYVAVSSEGFSIKSEEEFAQQADKNFSGMVFTSRWDWERGKLKMEMEDGKITLVQVFVPSKFRDQKGNLVDLFEDFDGQTGEGKYVKTSENGSVLLKEEMFSTNLLELFSFRIPFSKMALGAKVEIAGFTPSTSGDIMILPGALTKVKGLDFDIDKENSYQYWTYQNEKGEFKILNEESKRAILQDLTNKINSAGGDKNKIISALNEYALLSQKDSEELSEDSVDEILEFLSDELDRKVLQNDLIEIYHAMYGATNSTVKSKLSKVLSTKFSEDEAKFITDLKNRAKSQSPIQGATDITKMFSSPLTESYQWEKMRSGAAGKIGIASAAVDVVYHGLLQQLRDTGKGVSILELEEENRNLKNAYFRFGNVKMDGSLGKRYSYDGTSIADVLDETAQITVDNEKLQVMGRVGLSEETLDANKAMEFLGLNKFSKDGHSIPFLLFSQPIVQEYITTLRNMKSPLSDDFSSNKEDIVFFELANKYLQNILPEDSNVLEYIYTQLDDDSVSDLLNEQSLIEAISARKPEVTHGLQQIAALIRFKDMTDIGVALRETQELLNIDSQGLGKSYFGALRLANKLANLNVPKNITTFFGKSLVITGLSNLIGDYAYVDLEAGVTEESLISQGYSNINGTFIKPTTFTGAYAVNGIVSALESWKSVLPHNTAQMRHIISQISKHTRISEGIDKKSDVDNIQIILDEYKKYLNTIPITGLYPFGKDINDVRRSLFIDSEENTSLAMYLFQLMNYKTDDPQLKYVLDNFIKGNNFLNSLFPEINKNGEPSRIIYNNTISEEFDEQYLYNGFASLFNVDALSGKLLLPKIGNKQYTVGSLAEALVTYAMLGDSKQEATQFSKFITRSYLKKVGYNKAMRFIHNTIQSNQFLEPIRYYTLGDKKIEYPSNFTVQFLQHNPDLIRESVSLANLNKQFDVRENGMVLVPKDDYLPTFFRVYDNSIKGTKKYRIYQLGPDGLYHRIPVLGTTGMDEYQYGRPVGYSILDETRPTGEMFLEYRNLRPERPPAYNITDGANASDILNNIASDPDNIFSGLAALLSPITEDIHITIANEFRHGNKTYKNYNGISIGKKLVFPESIYEKSDNTAAQDIVHEAFHSVTSSFINPWVQYSEEGFAIVKEGAPSSIVQLANTFNYALRNSGIGDMASFRQKLMLQTEGDSLRLTQKEIDTFYGFTNLNEFITMATTSREFQETLNNIKYPDGYSVFARLLQVIQNILQQMGLTPRPGYTLQKAVIDIFTVIEEANRHKTENNPFSDLFKEGEVYDIFGGDIQFNGERIEQNLDINNPNENIDEEIDIDEIKRQSYLPEQDNDDLDSSNNTNDNERDEFGGDPNTGVSLSPESILENPVNELFESDPELANEVYSKILTNSGLSAKNILDSLLKNRLIEKQCS